MFWLLPAVPALVYTARATPLARLRSWWSWSTSYATWCVCVTATVLYINAVAGPLLVDRGVPRHVDWGAQLISSFGAPGVTRRLGANAERGASFALGTLRGIQRWFRVLLTDPIRAWAEDCSDLQLDEAAAVIDRRHIGRRAGVRARTKTRQARQRDMAAGGILRDETRADLIEYIVTGFASYEIPRPR